MVDKKEDWRKKEPSQKQLDFILSLGSSMKPKTSGEASSLINRLMLVTKIKKVRDDIVKKNIRTQTEVDNLTKAADNWFWDAALIYCAIADNCLQIGYDEPPQIGMFFNNYCAERRNT